MHLIQNHIQWACRLNRLIIATTVLMSVVSSPMWSQLSVGSLEGLDWTLVSVFVASLFVLSVNEILFHACYRLREDSERLTNFGLFLLGLLTVYIWGSALLTGHGNVLILTAFVGLEAQFLRRPLLSAQVYIFSVLALLVLGFLPELNPLHLSSTLQLALLGTTILPLFLPLYFMGHIVFHVVSLHYHQVESLQSLASTDALTGLINRRQFNTRLQSELSRARRHQSPLSLALFDIDNFKHINDHYGHQVGDRILKELGQLLMASVRESDVAARYGGEEFALILPEAREREAAELLERIRHAVSETVFCLPDNPITLTVSVGVADLNLRASKSSPFELIERADNALYEAKGTGKNKVVPASSMLGILSLQPV